jgi:hypothetical protein
VQICQESRIVAASSTRVAALSIGESRLNTKFGLVLVATRVGGVHLYLKSSIFELWYATLAKISKGEYQIKNLH